jgi:glutamyl-tRNA reductase
MHISLAGINHRTAPLEVREKAAIGTDGLPGLLHLLKQHAQHGVIVSTCNRTEVYATGGHVNELEKSCMDFLSNGMSLTADTSPYLYVMSDRAAFEHLFSVACGLDSMVIGEYEVLGQAGQALARPQRDRYKQKPAVHQLNRS